MDLSPDTILHVRYRIIRPLGKGGMGAVYLAFDNTLEHEVAVKSNLNPSEAATAQFLREARLLAKLRHPNLPRVIDHFVDNQQQFLVMDYVPGDDLGKLLENNGQLPLDMVISYARQLGDALTYLHSQEPPVIHRDIKPGNIKLMTADQVILVDFGIAKASTGQATSTGATGYTPGYAPPEQYGSGRTGPYSDQYSLAATLYQLLSGVHPVDSVQRLLGEAVLTPLNLLSPGIPPHVCKAIEKALSVKHEDRFPSVAEFINALINPSFTPMTAATQPLQKQKRAAPWVFVGIGAVLLLGLAVIIGGAGYLYMNRTPTAALAPVSPTAAVPMAVQPSQAPATGTPAVEPTASPKAETPAASLPTELPAPAASPTSGVKQLGKGKLVVFASDRSDGKTLQLWSMTVQLGADNVIKSSDPVQATTDTGNKSFPAWSPDGKLLIYSAPGPGENGLDLWLLRFDDPTQPAIRLTNIKGDDTRAAWSADGKLIAFTNRGRFQDLDQLYMMNPDGSDLKKVSTDFEESNPTWSPDSGALVYVIHASDHLYLYQRIKKDGYVTPKAYDPVEVFGRLGNVAGAAFSPDGKYIAYTRMEPSGNRIWSLDYASKGGKTTALTVGAFKENSPTWSPDGEWIAFTSGRDNNPEIYVMTSTGLMQTNLTNNPGKDLQPAWQP